MKLVYPSLNLKIDLLDNMVSTVVVENPNLLYEMLTDIENQINGNQGNFIISKDLDLFNFSKNVELISQLIPFTLNQRDLINKLYSSLNKKSSLEIFEKTNEIIVKIQKYLFELIDDSDIELSLKECNDITGLLKMFEVNFIEEHQSLVEKIIDYMVAVRNFKGDKIFIIVNARSYIDDKSIEKLFKDIVLRKFKVIFFEAMDRAKIKYENKTIIDKDLFII